MSSAKKYKITIAVACVVMLVIVGAIIGVLAASSQNLNVGFTVSYSVGDNVAVAVRTEYYQPGLDSDEDGEEDGVQTARTDSSGNEVSGIDANGRSLYFL